MALVYISLGSNIGNKRQQLSAAAALLSERAGSVIALSTFFETEPWGFDSDNTFLNAALILETTLQPLELLAITEQIEITLGRNHKSSGQQYVDRSIDIDLLMYDSLVMQTKRLTLPHPLMHERQFVMEPLAEIAAEVFHPIIKKSIHDIATELK